jgi:predicted transcriptional regulator
MLRRAFSNIPTPRNITAIQLFEKSCYFNLDFKINEEKVAREAVARFTAFNVGCLAVTDNDSRVIGVLSGRDYIHKVAALGKNDSEVKVKDIATYGPKLIVAKSTDSLDTCMHKMMFRGIRHMIVVDDKTNECVGLISVKDVIREVLKDKNEIITRLGDFRIGKGAYFGSE